MAVEQDKSQVREDSLIKEFKLLESDRSIYTYKIIFTTVRDIELVYYTNSKDFVGTLDNFKENKFIITYAFAGSTESAKDVENRIVKVKLPKTKK